MSKIFAYPALMALIVFFFFILGEESHPVDKLRGHLNLDDGAPFMVIYADPRSLSARSFVKAVETNIHHQMPELTLAIKSINSNPFKDLAAKTQLVPNPLGFSIKSNSYSVYFAGNDPVLKGDVFNNPESVISQLNKILGNHEPFYLEDYLMVGADIRSTPFISAIEGLPLDPVSVFVIFENICMVCDSGRTLLDVEALNKKIPDVSFTFLTVTNYSQAQINDFAQNHELAIPIYVVSPKFRQFWHGVGLVDGNNPMEGLVFVISADKNLLFAGNVADPEPFRRWLKNRSGKFIGKGD